MGDFFTGSLLPTGLRTETLLLSLHGFFPNATNDDDDKCDVKMMTIEVLEKFMHKAVKSCENTPKEIKKGMNTEVSDMVQECIVDDTYAAEDVKERDMKVEDEQVVRKKKLNDTKKIMKQCEADKINTSKLNAMIEDHMHNNYCEYEEQSCNLGESEISLASSQEEHYDLMRACMIMKMKQYKAEFKGAVEEEEESIEEKKRIHQVMKTSQLVVNKRKKIIFQRFWTRVFNEIEEMKKFHKDIEKRIADVKGMSGVD